MVGRLPVRDPPAITRGSRLLHGGYQDPLVKDSERRNVLMFPHVPFCGTRPWRDPGIVLRKFVDVSPRGRWQATAFVFSSTSVTVQVSGGRHFGPCRSLLNSDHLLKPGSSGASEVSHKLFGLGAEPYGQIPIRLKSLWVVREPLMSTLLGTLRAMFRATIELLMVSRFVSG